MSTSTKNSTSPINYYALIHKYFTPSHPLYATYITHVTLVTHLALKIARGLSLPYKDQRFIEEAAMLHDIGIVYVHHPKILYANGRYPYIAHQHLGYLILNTEGLPQHANVALRHGLGYYNYLGELIQPLTEAEKIISYADLFYSKSTGKLWQPKSVNDILNYIHTKWFPKNPQPYVDFFMQLHKKYGPFAFS